MEKPQKTPEIPAEPNQPEVTPPHPEKTEQPALPEIRPLHDPLPSTTPPEIKPGHE